MKTKRESTSEQMTCISAVFTRSVTRLNSQKYCYENIQTELGAEWSRPRIRFVLEARLCTSVFGPCMQRQRDPESLIALTPVPHIRLSTISTSKLETTCVHHPSEGIQQTATRCGSISLITFLYNILSPSSQKDGICNLSDRQRSKYEFWNLQHSTDVYESWW
jgi:hypothetical protein